LFFEPYSSDASSCGLAMDIVNDGRLSNWAAEADKAKLQLSIHAIGDKANNIILNLFEEIIEKNPARDRRFRIEHAQHLLEGDIKRFAELGVIASVQPYHLFDDGPWAERKIGKERLQFTYAFKSLLDAGVKVCFGSDWYVAPMNAILGIYAAVTRHTADGENRDGWIPGQKISIEQAVRCYTINSAYAAYEEKIKGSIEPGKLADLILLSEDIFSIPPQAIKDVKVVMTVFDGKKIF
jgi:predicted amidohydrolase YtcJ